MATNTKTQMTTHMISATTFSFCLISLRVTTRCGRSSQRTFDNAGCHLQTWSSRDLSLGLETSRDSFLQVLVSVLVLEPSSLGLGLDLGTSESRSWSWSWNPRVSVSVLVLEPQSLGLGLGLGTWDSGAFKQLHTLLKGLLFACHLCSCGTDI